MGFTERTAKRYWAFVWAWSIGGNAFIAWSRCFSGKENIGRPSRSTGRFTNAVAPGFPLKTWMSSRRQPASPACCPTGLGRSVIPPLELPTQAGQRGSIRQIPSRRQPRCPGVRVKWSRTRGKPSSSSATAWPSGGRRFHRPPMAHHRKRPQPSGRCRAHRGRRRPRAQYSLPPSQIRGSRTAAGQGYGALDSKRPSRHP